MSLNPLTVPPIRRHTHPVQVGPVTIGGGAPIVVQSMTDTDTADIQGTVTQILALVNAGSELVRITVNTPAAAKAVPSIREKLDAVGCAIPLIGDFHYNGDQQLTQFPDCARALAKYRINPGNVGFGHKRDHKFNTLIQCAIRYNKPIRIGVNWGSLDQQLIATMMDKNARLAQPKPAAVVQREALVTSALTSAEAARQQGLAANKIVISCKVSVVQDLIAVYRMLADRCEYPLHLGLTEAGMGDKGIIASTAGMAVLLQAGIGDTIRTSLTPAPGMPRHREVTVSQHMLQALGLRSFAPSVTACPGCGRTTSSYFRELTQTVETYIRSHMANWRCQYPGVEHMTVAVMGCIVNGPGESKHANIGISLPGTGESPAAPVFMDGKKVTTLRGQDISTQFLRYIDEYVKTRYAPTAVR